MRFIKLIITLLFSLIFSCFIFAQTDTPTETATFSETYTPTATHTNTQTFTITLTPTETSTPTPAIPPDKIIAYPNPAYGEKIVIAYPLPKNKIPKQVLIIINSIDGSEAGRIYDFSPNGYTEFNIKNLARGIYIYKVKIEYTDGSSEKFPHKKFAIIK